jgi:hypothetical protein
MKLTSEDLPGFYRAADEASLGGQQRFIRATSSRLALAIFVAVIGAFTFHLNAGRIDVIALVGAIAFLVALCIEIWLLAERPERSWYDGRALAESAKTLAWRYSVGGLPFPIGMKGDSLYFAEQLAGLLHDTHDNAILPTSGLAISAPMKALRAEELETRKAAYLEDRITDQQGWYARKAKYNAKRAERWKIVLIVTELGGAIAALLKAIGFLNIDLTSIASTMLGAGVAWLAVRQHESVGRAYTLASHELALIAARLPEVTDEASWAAEVADAEEAISREHTMWRAARAVNEPSLPIRRHPT